MILEALPIRKATQSLCSFNQLPWLRRPVLEQALFARSLRSPKRQQNPIENVFWLRNQPEFDKYHFGNNFQRRRFQHHLLDYIGYAREFYRNEYKQNNMFTDDEPSVVALLQPFKGIIIAMALITIFACFVVCAELAYYSKVSENN